MKKPLPRGEMWLFASPLLFMVIAGAAWMQQGTVSDVIVVADTDHIYRPEFSPDGKRLIVAYPNTRTDFYSNQIYDVKSRSKICDLEMPPLVSAIPQRNYLNTLAYQYFSWSNDGKSIVGSNYQEVAIWDAQSGLVKANFRYLTTKNQWRDGRIRFSPDDKTLVSVDVPRDVYDLTTGRRLNKPDASITWETRAKLSESGKLMARYIPSQDRFEVVDAKTKRTIWKSDFPEHFRFAWRGEILSVSDLWSAKRNHWMLWNGTTRRQLPTPTLPAGVLAEQIQLNPDKRTVAYAFGQKIPTKTAANTDLNEKATTVFEGELVVWDYLANRALWRRKLAAPVGSSRVDLQACKLEYSIVSPK